VIGQSMGPRGRATLLLRLIQAGGDPSVFCYRIGVDFLSAGHERFLANGPMESNLIAMKMAVLRPLRTGNFFACNLFSTFSTRFSIQKDYEG
jgi:hypothetical protein